MEFEYYFSVRGYEIDSYQHVNNAVYLSYMEQARWEILKKLDLFNYFIENQILLVVTDIHIRYVREAKVFDELVVKTTQKKEDPYLVFVQKIYNTQNNLKIAQGTVKTLLINKDRVPIDIPDEIAEMAELKLKKES